MLPHFQLYSELETYLCIACLEESCPELSSSLHEKQRSLLFRQEQPIDVKLLIYD